MVLATAIGVEPLRLAPRSMHRCVVVAVRYCCISEQQPTCNQEEVAFTNYSNEWTDHLYLFLILTWTNSNSVVVNFCWRSMMGDERLSPGNLLMNDRSDSAGAGWWRVGFIIMDTVWRSWTIKANRRCGPQKSNSQAFNFAPNLFGKSK